MKKVYFLIVLLLSLGLGACQSNEEPKDQTPVTDNKGLIELTLTELSAFDGKEGRKAYIAVNNDIYDVTDSPLWTSGEHNGFSAGQDLTDEILNLSPHGLSTLSGVPKVGILVNES